MRAIRNLVKERNNRTFVPYSFESMMQLFGQNMDREALSSKMEDFTKQLDKLVKNTSAPKTEIERTVQESLGNFMKMIMKNDVDEADLANQDNKLYQKLIDRSKSLPPGLKLDSAEAMYKFEQIATEQLMLKQRQMRRRRPGKEGEAAAHDGENFAAKDTSIIMEDS